MTVALPAMIERAEERTVTATMTVRAEGPGSCTAQSTSSVTEGVLTAKGGVSLLPKA